MADDLLRWNPGWIKDPWVELTALLGEQERAQLVPVILQLQSDMLTAQLKAVQAMQAMVGKQR